MFIIIAVEDIDAESLCGTQKTIKAIRTTNAPLFFFFVVTVSCVDSGNKVWSLNSGVLKECRHGAILTQKG